MATTVAGYQSACLGLKATRDLATAAATGGWVPRVGALTAALAPTMKYRACLEESTEAVPLPSRCQARQG